MSGIFMIGNLLTYFFLAQRSFKGKAIVTTLSIRALIISPGLSGHRVVLLLFRLITCLRSTGFLSNVHRTHGLHAFAYQPGEVPTKLVLSMPKRLHCLLVDKPASARGPTIWLTKPAGDFLKGLRVVRRILMFVSPRKVKLKRPFEMWSYRIKYSCCTIDFYRLCQFLQRLHSITRCSSSR